MTAVHALVDSLVLDLRAHQVAWVDLLPALQAASPGAFLADDYHLSPSGHAVVAQSLDALMHTQVAGVTR